MVFVHDYYMKQRQETVEASRLRGNLQQLDHKLQEEVYKGKGIKGIRLHIKGHHVNNRQSILLDVYSETELPSLQANRPQQRPQLMHVQEKYTGSFGGAVHTRYIINVNIAMARTNINELHREILKLIY